MQCIFQKKKTLKKLLHKVKVLFIFTSIYIYIFLIGTLAVAFRETRRGAKREGMSVAQYGKFFSDILFLFECFCKLAENMQLFILKICFKL